MGARRQRGGGFLTVANLTTCQGDSYIPENVPMNIVPAIRHSFKSYLFSFYIIEVDNNIPSLPPPKSTNIDARLGLCILILPPRHPRLSPSAAAPPPSAMATTPTARPRRRIQNSQLTLIFPVLLAPPLYNIPTMSLHPPFLISTAQASWLVEVFKYKPVDRKMWPVPTILPEEFCIVW